MATIVEHFAKRNNYALTVNQIKALAHLKDVTLNPNKSVDFDLIHRANIADMGTKLHGHGFWQKVRANVYEAQLLKDRSDPNNDAHNNSTNGIRRQYFVDCLVAGEALPLVTM